MQPVLCFILLYRPIADANEDSFEIFFYVLHYATLQKMLLGEIAIPMRYFSTKIENPDRERDLDK